MVRKQKRRVKEKKHSGHKERKPEEQAPKGQTGKIAQMRGEVKDFIEKFKSDVAEKRKGYQLYALKLRKKEKR